LTRLAMKQIGWILDLYQKSGQMIVWLKKQDGRCVRLVDRWTPKIHVGGDFGDLLNLACQLYMKRCRFVEKFEKAGDRFRSRVLEVEVKTEKEASNLAGRIQRYGGYSKFRLYDVDVPFAQMYLYEKDLFPLAYVEAENAKEGIQWTVNDSRDATGYEVPRLNKIRLQVETRKAKRVRGFDDELDSVTFLHDDGKTVIDSGDESYKLLKTVDAFQCLDPDIIITDGGDSFIFPYLAHRAQQNGISDRLILDRERTPLRVQESQGHSYFSYGKVLYRQTAAHLPGRIHIDEANAFFVNDCGFEGLFEVARTCVIPIQRTSRTTIGTSMTSLQLYHAVKADVLIPWNKNDPEEFKDGNELVVADRGGFIFEPKVGIHDDVGELDFASLYPTIMLNHNLSGETVRCKCCPDSVDRVPELGFNICERWVGIVPRSLDILLRKRALYKRYKKEAKDPPTRLRYDQRQAALKWILVCS
jgi:DNA polymerase I